ncbi:ABC transporter permease subunit [Fredinandcohnia sp. QZ13]|uniref:ABC transporter permease subunit n=1 Tax=Fredinandcohnia sp. QZ13 TaxID=3073144 RepID=UPI00285311EA|nr:ABC transporter permease subunit [Fredinandcohnia sp. QZ13]MDR4888045.1 ABC transporter permease subunit [Fredinandcohnia sp. QZ13]
MNVFLRELKAYRKSLIIWSVGIVMLILMGKTKYSSLSTSGQSLNELIESMPKALQALMGTGTLDVSTLIGYFSILYVYLLLMATIHGAMMGSSIIAKEERDKTFEFLFVKPITRTKVISMKLTAGIFNLVVFNVVTTVATILIFEMHNEIADIFMLMGGMFILQVLFLMIGSALASIIRNTRSAAPIATGILLLTFILSIVIDLSEKLENLSYIVPFKYFAAKDMLTGDGFEAVFVIISLSLIAILTIVTFVFYKKRDLNV